MAQSATKRTPLGIDPFWDKPTPDPPLRWEKWIVQYKLALLQKRILFSGSFPFVAPPVRYAPPSDRARVIT